MASRVMLPLRALAVNPLLSSVQTREFAARRGTRAKMAKKKVKLEVKKIGFIPHNLREKKGKGTGPLKSRRFNDDFKKIPIDDVWVKKFWRLRIFDFEDAIECIRETHHPELYNVPDAPVAVFIEMDMTGVKKNKYVDPFSKIAGISHPFNHNEKRSVLAFCKTPELKNEAEVNGATLVGDVDVIKKIERGEIVLPDFDYIVAHPNILPELVSLRGLLKKRFPNPKSGTLGANIGKLIETIRNGIQYTAQRDDSEMDYGFVSTSIGPLDMETTKLRDNLKSLLESIQENRPKRPGPFVTRYPCATYYYENFWIFSNS
ncbi:unnamed protein product [Nesidiocoris tenuis]|uniref:39S ribosomal protein L1, mitochondrial n=1 Tax=Nesidiocoris tenuis TaxID=355587 RepID=A0A6H5GYL4_9HEMI|nr:unnamed protein product [Nesidiocoris tenuis]